VQPNCPITPTPIGRPSGQGISALTRHAASDEAGASGVLSQSRLTVVASACRRSDDQSQPTLLLIAMSSSANQAGCAADAITPVPPVTDQGVTLELRYSPTCHANWARITPARFNWHFTVYNDNGDKQDERARPDRAGPTRPFHRPRHCTGLAARRATDGFRSVVRAGPCCALESHTQPGMAALKQR
jgi:hypothetical protein